MKWHPEQRQLQWVILLLVSWATLVSSEIVVPRIELQRVHVEYEGSDSSAASTANSNAQKHRSAQQQDTTAYQYEPIRIAFDTRVLDSLYGRGDADVDAKIDFIKSTILPRTKQKWSQHLYVRPIVSSVTPIIINEQTCAGLYSEYLTTAIQYTDADLVVIVGGDPAQICSDGGTLAYAFPCNIDTTYDRPITGTFNFCLSKLSSTSLQIGDGMTVLQQLSASDIPMYYSLYTNTTFYPEKLGISILDVTVHEVAHILGFSDLLYPYTRDEDGVPRTVRDANNNNAPIPTERKCGNGTITFDYLPPESVVQVVQPSATDLSRYEHYFVTDRIRTISQIHFNCSTLIGGRLEDVAVGAPQCFGSHWHERFSYSELLSPTVSEGSENILSLLTLAFMEDTGWYKVDYRGAGYPSFGLGAGCEFVTGQCINSTTGEVSDVVDNEFCSSPLYLDVSGIPTLESLNHVLCDPSHQSWTICDLSDLRPLEINERTYFPDASLSTIVFQRADNCPIPSLSLGLNCFDDTIPYSAFYAGESVGPNSRCLNAYTDSTMLGRTFRPACIRVTCDLNERVVRIGQDDTELICDYDGQLLTVLGGRTDGATLVCPRLASICPALFTCPDGCFGRGDCVYVNVDSSGRTIPTCRCFDTNNTHSSCAPSFIVNQSTNVTTFQPVSSPTSNPPTTFSPIAVPPLATVSPTLIAAPVSPTMQTTSPTQSPTDEKPVLPVIPPMPPSLPPNTGTPTRAPVPEIRRTNVPMADQTTSPTRTSGTASFYHACHVVAPTVWSTIVMLLVTNR